MDYSAIFGERAGSYIEACERWPDVRSEEISAFMQQLELKPGEDFLDAPCGNGLVAKHVPADCHYKGIDTATPFVDFCRSRGLDCHQGSLRHSGLDSSSYDVIGSLAGIHHEENRFELYQEWWRVLRPGGRVVVMDVWENSLAGDFLNGFINAWNSHGHSGYFLNDTDLCFLHEAGFKQVDTQSLNYYWQSDSDAQMHSFMTALFGLDLRSCVQDMQDAWAHLGWQHADQVCRIPWSLSCITAQK